MAGARRRRLLERRRRLRRARSRRGDGRDVRGGSRRLRGSLGRAAARGSSSTGSTSSASARAARSRTAATCMRGSPRRCEVTIRDGLAARPPAGHGLVVPAVSRRRALARLGRRRAAARSPASRSRRRRPTSRRPRSKASAYRIADVLDALGGVESVVVTGGGLLANPGWLQMLADVLGRPLEVSGVAGGIGARRGRWSRSSGSACRSRRRRSRRVVEPRPGRTTRSIWSAMAEQRKLMQSQEAR